MCFMMDQWHSCLCERRTLQELKVIDKLPKPFFKEEEEARTACEETWNKIVEQIEAELGPVILACPFGSQRCICMVSFIFNIATAIRQQYNFVLSECNRVKHPSCNGCNSHSV